MSDNRNRTIMLFSFLFLKTPQNKQMTLTLLVLCLIISCSSRDDCLIVHWSIFCIRERITVKFYSCGRNEQPVMNRLWIVEALVLC